MSEKTTQNSENKKQGENPKDSRREFLKSIGLVGAGAVIVGGALHSAKKYQDKKKTVRVLSHDGELLNISTEEIKLVKLDNSELAKRGREGIQGKRWVMVIDLAKCRNARKCIASCQSAHELRPHEYHINTLLMQDTEHTSPYYMPKPCQHCDNPPCVSVCPVGATFKRQDGIVLIDNERCIGCRFCMAACPYSARMFHWEEPMKAAEKKTAHLEYDKYMEHGELDKALDLKKMLEYDVERNVPQRKGTISKCLFSADRLREGKLPSCVSACPNGVFYFGDENEDAVTNGTTNETVRLSELKKKNAAYQLMPELGTQPRVYYLPPKNRLFEINDEDAKDIHGNSHA